MSVTLHVVDHPLAADALARVLAQKLQVMWNTTIVIENKVGASGTIGTAFYNHGFEARVEIVQADRGVWHGASGMQLFSRDFDVVGDLNSGWPVTPHPFLQAVSHGSLPPVNLQF